MSRHALLAINAGKPAILQLDGLDFAAGRAAYLNNASVSLMPRTAIGAVRDFLARYSEAGPDSKAGEPLVSGLFDSTRRRIAGIINCQPDEIIFTQSVTDGVNYVANGMKFDDRAEIVIRGSIQEHHANYYPWLRLGRRCAVRSLPVDPDGLFGLDVLSGMLTDKTALLALSHGLYNTGAILPVEEIGRIAGERGVPFFLDAAQTVGCMEVDVQRIGCDFMAFNGSKWLCGPMGTGVLYCSRRSRDLLEPVSVGGESAILYEGKLAYKEMPDRFQAGFRNYAGIAGLGESAKCLSDVGIGNIRRTDIGLAELLRGELERMGAALYGPADPAMRTSIVSFNMPGTDPEAMVSRLEQDGVILAVREIGGLKVARASPHLFNTSDEMMRAAESIRRAKTGPAPASQRN